MMRLFLPWVALLFFGTGALAQTDAGEEPRLDQKGAEAKFSTKERFGKVDRNNDGLINLYELATALGAEAGWFSDSDTVRRPSAEPGGQKSAVAEVFVRADRDGSGSLDPLEYENYMQIQRQGNVDMPSVAPNIFEKRF